MEYESYLTQLVKKKNTLAFSLLLSRAKGYLSPAHTTAVAAATLLDHY